MTNAIEAEGLTKRFGDTQALAGIDLAAREGIVLGVLGPNGAGKTTAVRILATLLRADSGHAARRRLRRRHPAPAGPPADRAHRPVRVGRRGPHRHAEPGHDRPAARPVHPRRPRPRAANCSSGSTSTEAADRVAKTYSGGMRRRLDLAASLVGRPAIVFLDEPTTGLDPAKREAMWDVVRRLVTDGLDRAAHHAVPRGGRRPGRRDHASSTAAASSPTTPRSALKRVVGGQRLTVRPTRPVERSTRSAPSSRRRQHEAGRAGRPGRAQRPGRQRRGADRRGRPPARGRHRRHRTLPAPAEPGRGVLHHHRPPDRRPTRRTPHERPDPDQDRRPAPDAGRGRDDGPLARAPATSGTPWCWPSAT